MHCISNVKQIEKTFDITVDNPIGVVSHSNFRNAREQYRDGYARGVNRTIPLTDNIIDALRTEQKKQAENKVLFGNCYSEIDNCIIRNKDGRPYSNLSCINRVVNRLMEKAQLKHCTIHGLRHTVASLLDDNGVPIQEISTLLGHKNVSTTEKIYIHRKSTAKAENIMLLNNLYGN